MKRVVLSLAVVALAATIALAGGKKQTLSGHLVDIACSNEHAPEGEAFGAKHSKECLLMSDCVKSGYAVLTADKQVIKFDAKGNEEAKKQLAGLAKEKDIRVSVTGTVEGDSIQVASLKVE
ncbi:MAG TPA: hypothetical protein VNK82_08450 [Terriglobales bacterium]|nr:hypothetical protein [Terriglobales bacterium]